MLVCFTMLALNGNSQTNDTTLTVQIKVSGIGCSGDMGIIKKKLINQEGIDEVTYTEKKGDASIFNVLFHPSVITERKIREVIESAPCCDNPNEFPYKAKKMEARSKKKQQ